MVETALGGVTTVVVVDGVVVPVVAVLPVVVVAVVLDADNPFPLPPEFPFPEFTGVGATVPDCAVDPDWVEVLPAAGFCAPCVTGAAEDPLVAPLAWLPLFPRVAVLPEVVWPFADEPFGPELRP